MDSTLGGESEADPADIDAASSRLSSTAGTNSTAMSSALMHHLRTGRKHFRRRRPQISRVYFYMTNLIELELHLLLLNVMMC